MAASLKPNGSLLSRALNALTLCRVPDTHEIFGEGEAGFVTNGPLKRMEVKELLAQSGPWQERTRSISEMVGKGELPLMLAASSLRTTMVDMVLRNLVRNASISDARRRLAVPLFSGRRSPSKLGKVQRIAFDTSSLLVLGWLGILPQVITSYPDLAVPAGALHEIFEGRARIRQFQKSRLQLAAELQDAIAHNRLKVHKSSPIPRDPLSNQIGFELASLIRAAEATNGVVIRPAPVPLLGPDKEGDADLSSYKAARSNATRLMENDGIQARIAEIMAVGAERAEVTAEEVIRELKKLGFSCIGKAVTWRNEVVTQELEGGEEGETRTVMVPRVTIVPTEDLDKATLDAIAEVSQQANGAVRVKMHDKHAALVSLGKHLGLFADRVQIERKQISAEPMSAEEWKKQFVREG
jgi:phage terminase small subunit